MCRDLSDVLVSVHGPAKRGESVKVRIVWGSVVVYTGAPAVLYFLTAWRSIYPLWVGILAVFYGLLAAFVVCGRMGEPRPSMPKRGSETRLCDECGMGRSCRCP